MGSASSFMRPNSRQRKRLDNEFIDMAKKRDIRYMTTFIDEEGYREVLNQQVDLSDFEKRMGDPQVIATWAELAKIPRNEIPGGLRPRPEREMRPIAFD